MLWLKEIPPTGNNSQNYTKGFTNYKGILNVSTQQAGVHFALSTKLYRYDIGNSKITPTIPPATLNIHFHCTNAINECYPI